MFVDNNKERIPDSRRSVGRDRAPSCRSAALEALNNGPHSQVPERKERNTGLCWGLAGPAITCAPNCGVKMCNVFRVAPRQRRGVWCPY